MVTDFDTTNVKIAEQYFQVYNARLEAARPALIKNSRHRWGNEIQNILLEELNASLGNTEVFIIGTLFKIMPNQPSILKDEKRLITYGADENFTSDEDSLVLHEIDENVVLVGDIDPHCHVTGIPVSLRGRQIEGGAKFSVTDICYAGLELSVFKMQAGSQDKVKSRDRLLIISGLEFGFDLHLSKDDTNKVISALKKLQRFICGESSGDEMNGYAKNRVTKIIIAGNSIAPGYTKAKMELSGSKQSQMDSHRSLNDVLKMFDQYLFNLAQSGAEIYLMPGRNDPTTYLLPQQPFHPKILPKSGVLSNLRPVTNPKVLEFGNVNLLGTSGENIDVIRQCTRSENNHATKILVNTIEWGHIAPCAPDNLSCIPFSTKDLFLLESTYDVYFVGNQNEFSTSTYYNEDKPKMLMISVPSFIKTKSCVLVDLVGLECEQIHLN